jgi:hypothetical protein
MSEQLDQLVTVHRARLVDFIDLARRANSVMRGQNSHDPLVSALDGAIGEIEAELLVPVG